MPSYLNPYTGQTISPSQVGYESLSISSNISLEWPINGNTSNVVANIIDVTASVNNLTITMPAATQVSNGQSTLFNNIGSRDVFVLRNNGSALVTLEAGKAVFVWVTDNSTVAGTWDSIGFGAGTSLAQATSLAGFGLTVINNTLNQSYPVSYVYSNYTFLPSDRSSFFVWSSGVGTFTMPSASTLGNNWFVMIRNGGTGILTVNPSGVDTIDNNSSVQLQIDESLVICSNGSSGFSTFGYGQSAQFFFTILAKPVTGGTVTLTAAESANVIQEYSGVLTSNCTVILPPTVQLYSLQNQTSGAFSLTFRTTAVGATTVILPQGQTLIAICDGTNVYNASSATISSISALTLGNGTAAAPSLNFLGDNTTGLFLPSSGQLGFAISGVSAGTLTSTGLRMPVGIAGGTF
jgi:hypothetical protein